MRLTTFATFECDGKSYHYNINILVDTGNSTLNFHFEASNDHAPLLPVDARRFDVITTFTRTILFDRLAASGDHLQETIRLCVEAFLKNAEVPGLNEAVYEG